MASKSLLIKDTTVDERMEIVKIALGGFATLNVKASTWTTCTTTTSSDARNWLR